MAYRVNGGTIPNTVREERVKGAGQNAAGAQNAPNYGANLNKAGTGTKKSAKDTGGGGYILVQQGAQTQGAPMQDADPSGRYGTPNINPSLPGYQIRQGQTPQFDYSGQQAQFSYDGSAPAYEYDGQAPQFDYSGQRPEFSYDGKTPGFSYDGNAPHFDYQGERAEFRAPEADAALQAQYRDAMDALEKMKGQAPTYGSEYDGQIRQLYDQITGRGNFSYDSATDPLYQGYKDEYLRQGKQAMRDTMGQAAALTGGYGSTYGQAVGQQAYDQYIQRLAEVLPETYGLALEAWKAQGEDLEKKLALTQDLERTDYERYLDRLGQYNTDLNRAREDVDVAYGRMWDADERAYSRAADEYERERLAEQEAYSRASDQFERDRLAEERAYGRASDAYERARLAEKEDYGRAVDAYERERAAEESAYGRALDKYDRDRLAEETAYGRAADQYERDRRAEETAYGRAADQYERDRRAEETAYGRTSDAYKRAWDAYESDYGRQQDEYDRRLKENETAYGRAIDAYNLEGEAMARQGDSYNRLVSLMALGYQPTAQDFADAGLSVAQGQALAAAYAPEPEPSYAYVPYTSPSTPAPSDQQADTGAFDQLLASYFDDDKGTKKNRGNNGKGSGSGNAVKTGGTKKINQVK